MIINECDLLLSLLGRDTFEFDVFVHLLKVVGNNENSSTLDSNSAMRILIFCYRLLESYVLYSEGLRYQR